MRAFSQIARTPPAAPQAAAPARAPAAQPAPRGHQLSRFSTHPRNLSQPERSFFEPRLGTSLADVRVHEGASAATAAAAIGANAFTYGRDVVLGDTKPAERQRTLAHELVHVAQGAGNRDESIHGRAEAGVLHRAACTQSNRDQGGAGQLVVQDYFYNFDPGGGTWYREFEVPKGSLGGGTGYADLVWDSPGDVYVYEMKKDAAGGRDRRQAEKYRKKIAYFCTGRASTIFNHRTIRRGTAAVLPMAQVPGLSNRRYIQLTVPGNAGVLVYSYQTLAGTAGGAVGPGGLTGTQRETFRNTVVTNLAAQLVPATVANATLAAGVPGAAGTPAQTANATHLWEWLIRSL